MGNGSSEVQTVVRKTVLAICKYSLAKTLLLEKFANPENRRNGVAFKRFDSQLRGLFRMRNFLADNSPPVKGLGQALTCELKTCQPVVSLQDQWLR